MMLVKAFVVYFDINDTPFKRPASQRELSEEPFLFNGGILMNDGRILKLPLIPFIYLFLLADSKSGVACPPLIN